MSHSDRLTLIRARATALGLLRVVALPGLFTVSRAEVQSEAHSLDSYQADRHSEHTVLSTADDDSEIVTEHPDALADAAARRLGYNA